MIESHDAGQQPRAHILVVSTAGRFLVRAAVVDAQGRSRIQSVRGYGSFTPLGRAFSSGIDFPDRVE